MASLFKADCRRRTLGHRAGSFLPSSVVLLVLLRQETTVPSSIVSLFLLLSPLSYHPSKTQFRQLFNLLAREAVMGLLVI